MQENSHSYSTYINEIELQPNSNFTSPDLLTAQFILQFVTPTPATLSYRKKNGQVVNEHGGGGVPGGGGRQNVGGGRRRNRQARIRRRAGGGFEVITEPEPPPSPPPRRQMHRFIRVPGDAWRLVPGLSHPVCGVEFRCHRSGDCPARIFVYYGHSTECMRLQSEPHHLLSHGSTSSSPISLEDDDLMDCSIQEYEDGDPIGFDPILQACLRAPLPPPSIHVVPLRRLHVCLSDFTLRYELDPLVVSRVAWPVHRNKEKPLRSHPDLRRILLQTLTNELVVGDERPESVAHVYTLFEIVGLKRIRGKTVNNVKVWKCCDTSCCIVDHGGMHSPIRRCNGEVWQYGEVVKGREERDWVRQRFFSPEGESGHLQHTFVLKEETEREEVVDGPPVDLFERFRAMAPSLVTAIPDASIPNPLFSNTAPVAVPIPSSIPPRPVPPFVPTFRSPTPPPPNLLSPTMMMMMMRQQQQQQVRPPPPPVVLAPPPPVIHHMGLLKRYAPGGDAVPPPVPQISPPPEHPAIATVTPSSSSSSSLFGSMDDDDDVDDPEEEEEFDSDDDDDDDDDMGMGPPPAVLLRRRRRRERMRLKVTLRRRGREPDPYGIPMLGMEQDGIIGGISITEEDEDGMPGFRVAPSTMRPTPIGPPPRIPTVGTPPPPPPPQPQQQQHHRFPYHQFRQ